LAGLVLAAAGLGAFAQGTAGDALIFEPTIEAPDAQKRGASEVERAQKLAKAKQFADAASVLEALSKKLPASVHDCNLALAYLRASALTRAQLAWDLSGLRNGVRPKWCTGEVSTQLSEALRAAKYVPTTLDVVPADALVEVGGAAIRNMRTVWLPAGPTTIQATAPGMVAKTVTVTIAGPNARVAMSLEAPPPPMPPDAGMPEPMATPDAAMPVYTPPPVQPDAAMPFVPPDNHDDALLKVGGSPVGYKAASLTLAAVGWVSAITFGVLSYQASNDANGLYPTDPAFADKKDEYQTYSYLTLGGAILGAVSTGFFVYFATQGDSIIKKPGKIRVGVTPDGSFGVSWGGTFGGGK